MLIKTSNGWEYWQDGDQVYRVAVGNRGYLTASGVPSNARWECSLEHFRRYENKGAFDKSVRICDMLARRRARLKDAFGEPTFQKK